MTDNNGLKTEMFFANRRHKTIPVHMDHTDVHMLMTSLLSKMYIFIVYTETVTVSLSKTGTVKSV